MTSPGLPGGGAGGGGVGAGVHRSLFSWARLGLGGREGLHFQSPTAIVTAVGNVPCTVSSVGPSWVAGPRIGVSRRPEETQGWGSGGREGMRLSDLRNPAKSTVREGHV